MSDYDLRRKKRIELGLKIEEFYNQSHGQGGRFTSGGSVSGRAKEAHPRYKPLADAINSILDEADRDKTVGVQKIEGRAKEAHPRYKPLADAINSVLDEADRNKKNDIKSK